MSTGQQIHISKRRDGSPLLSITQDRLDLLVCQVAKNHGCFYLQAYIRLPGAKSPVLIVDVFDAFEAAFTLNTIMDGIWWDASAPNAYRETRKLAESCAEQLKRAAV